MAEPAEQLALLVRAAEGPGILAQLTRVLADHGANIARVDIVERGNGGAVLYFELESVADVAALLRDLAALPPVQAVEQAQPFAQIYGKRVIVIGAGAGAGRRANGWRDHPGRA
jgi:energy-converting hydrogenase B subunit Q